MLGDLGKLAEEEYPISGEAEYRLPRGRCYTNPRLRKGVSMATPGSAPSTPARIVA